MPPSARRGRERAGTRAGILAAALDVLENEGAAALTIRRIATEVDYTAPVVYQHFANKDALLLAVVEIGYGRLHAGMAEAARDGTAEERLLAAAAAYLAYAAEHPHLYRTMNAHSVDPHARLRAATPVIELTLRLLGEWFDDNGITPTEPMDACETVWGTMHGMAALGEIQTVGHPRAARLARRTLRAVLHAWRTDEESRP